MDYIPNNYYYNEAIETTYLAQRYTNVGGRGAQTQGLVIQSSEFFR